jgi:peptidoglycan/LPS O-acetylase OafA/YrhL
MYVESKRLEYLDSIRGVAALFVLLSHTVAAFAWPKGFDTFLNLPFVSILFSGQEAVCMFFVLSGYVLSKPYFRSPGNPSPRTIFLPTFYVRRFTRIWPPWFFVFVLSIIAKKYWFCQPATEPPVSNWLAQFWHAPMTAEDFFRQCAFQLHDFSRQLLVQDWSLGVELKGSLLIPLFVFLLQRGHMGWLLLVLAVAFPICLGTGQYYVSFIIGAVLARYGEFAIPSVRFAKAALLVLGLLLYQTIGILIAIFPGPKLASQYGWGWIATSLGCALVLLAVFGSQSLQQRLSHKSVAFLGRVLIRFILSSSSSSFVCCRRWSGGAMTGASPIAWGCLR